MGTSAGIRFHNPQGGYFSRHLYEASASIAQKWARPQASASMTRRTGISAGIYEKIALIYVKFAGIETIYIRFFY